MSVADTAEAPPGTDRVAGRAQGILLLTGSTLPILGALLIAPVLPKIQDEFADVSGVEALAPIALSVPSLAIGLLAPFAGRIIDRVGRIRLLLWALPLYVIAGTAPLYLNSLPAIIGSRALLGVAESAIMTACVTLLGDYYTGKTRDRYLSIHAVAAAFGAVIFLGVGGALGENGWRTPFWVYLVGLVFLPLMAWLLFPPARGSRVVAAGAAVRWSRLTPLLVLTFLGAIVFYALQVQLSVVLDDLGEGSGAIGASAAVANLALALAAVGFGVFNRGRPNAFLIAALLLAGGGLVLLAFGTDWLTVTLGAIVAGAGGGFMLPALLIGVTSRVEFENRGTVTGAWTAAFFLGQFVSPIVVNGLDAATGSLATALKIVGVFGIVLVVPALIIVRRTPLLTNASVLAGPVPPAAAESVELPVVEEPVSVSDDDEERDESQATDLTGRIDPATVAAALAAHKAATEPIAPEPTEVGSTASEKPAAEAEPTTDAAVAADARPHAAAEVAEAEEPAAEAEPKPVAAAPAEAEPVADAEPAAREAATSPVEAASVAEEPTAEAAAEPAASESVAAESVAAEPAADAPVGADLVAAEPVAEAVVAEPVAEKPAAAEEAVEAAAAEPAAVEPAAPETGAAEPGTPETGADGTVVAETVADETVAVDAPVVDEEAPGIADAEPEPVDAEVEADVTAAADDETAATAAADATATADEVLASGDDDAPGLADAEPEPIEDATPAVTPEEAPEEVSAEAAEAPPTQAETPAPVATAAPASTAAPAAAETPATAEVTAPAAPASPVTEAPAAAELPSAGAAQATDDPDAPGLADVEPEPAPEPVAAAKPKA